MKKILSFVIINFLVLVSNTYAGNEHNDNKGNNEYHHSSEYDAPKGNTYNSGGQGGSSYSGAAALGVGVGVGVAGVNSNSSANVSGNNSGSSASIGRIVNQGSTFNQVRQTPFAYAPSTNVGSGKYRCKDGVAVGVSSGFGAISGGMPITDELCQQLVIADWLADHNLMQESCEMMMLDERVKEVFKKTGRACSPTPVVTSSYSYTPPKFIDPDQQYKLNSIYKHMSRK